MPKTAVFFPDIMNSPGMRSFLSFNVQLAGYIILSSYFSSLCFNRSLLVVRSYGSFQGHLTVLRNDFHIMGIGRQRLVFHDRLANLLRHIAVRRFVPLLVCCGLVCVLIALVNLCVVGWNRS